MPQNPIFDNSDYPDIYICGALTGFSVDRLTTLRRRYELYGDIAKSFGFIAHIPHLHTDPVNNADVTPRYVFWFDTTAILRSKLMIADVSNLSHGAGMEMMLAWAIGLPILLIKFEESEAVAQVSRLVLGNPNIIKTINPTTEGQAKELISRFFSSYLLDIRASKLLANRHWTQQLGHWAVRQFLNYSDNVN
jgi:hypothetical protein